MESAGPAHSCIQSLTQQMFTHGGGQWGEGTTTPWSFKPAALPSFYLILSSKWIKGEGCKNKTSWEAIRETKCQVYWGNRACGRVGTSDPVRCQGAPLVPAGDPFFWPRHAPTCQVGWRHFFLLQLICCRVSGLGKGQSASLCSSLGLTARTGVLSCWACLVTWL